jgi:hypothetical protein
MNSSIIHDNNYELIHKKCHAKSCRSEIKYDMTLNIIFSVDEIRWWLIVLIFRDNRLSHFYSYNVVETHPSSMTIIMNLFIRSAMQKVAAVKLNTI